MTGATGALRLLLGGTPMDPTEGKKYVADLLKKTGDEFRAGASKEHAELAGVVPSKQEHVEMVPGDEPLAKKGPSRQLIALRGADDLKTPEDRAAFAEEMANAAVKAWTTDEIIEDPEGWYEAMLPERRRENPGMTDAQIRANFEAARSILGF
jgi:hypothetical protein